MFPRAETDCSGAVETRRSDPSTRRCIPLAALCAWLCLAAAAPALELDLPGDAQLTRQTLREADSYRLPVGPWVDGALPTLDLEGRVLRQAWRIADTDLTTLELMRPIRAQLAEAGFEPLLECAGDACGGFDFRFGTQVMAAPDMFVDLFDFRFLSARAAGPRYMSVFVSRSGQAGYVQIIRVGPEGAASQDATANAPSEQPAAPDAPGPAPQVVQDLVAQGHVVLTDLDFSSASSDLGPGPYASLSALAAWLKADGSRRVALVGHTDTVGGLEANIALSRRRAASVMRRLIEAHDVSAAQLEANGMGYLSPVAPNLTRDGREANRRVEAVLLNSE